MHPDPIPVLKRELARELLASIAGIPFFAAAELLGIDEPRFCDLRRGREHRFSLEKLIRMLANANRGVDITVVNMGPERLPWMRILHSRREAARTSDC